MHRIPPPLALFADMLTWACALRGAGPEGKLQLSDRVFVDVALQRFYVLHFRSLVQTRSGSFRSRESALFRFRLKHDEQVRADIPKHGALA